MAEKVESSRRGTVPDGRAVLRTWLNKKRVSVVGLGKSGLSAAHALSQCGARLFLSEQTPRKQFMSKLPDFAKRAEQEWGGQSRRILESELIIVSPGVDLDSPVFRHARKMGLPVWGELELGFRLGNFGKIAAVTGTNGKTTTVSLLGDMCARTGRRTLVAGNIGKPLCDYVRPSVKYDFTVLEVSSYQLESIDAFCPDAAALLNLTEDHLHRHKTMKEYASAKKRIFCSQRSDGFALLNAQDIWCRRMAANIASKVIWFSSSEISGRGVFFDSARQKIVAKLGSRTLTFPGPAHLPGMHNIENSCAAVGLALGLGVSPQAVRKSLLNFRGVVHRLEKIAVIRGVGVINDSKATNVDSTLKALDSFENPVWLILGGEDKGAPYSPLRDPVSQKVKGLMLIGESSSKIAAELKGAAPIFRCGTLKRAVKESLDRAVSGDIVLLSPACASFDQFDNFEDRGKRFKNIVKSFLK